MKQHHIITKIRRISRRLVRRHAEAVFVGSPITAAALVLGLALLWPPQPAPTTAVAAANHQYTFAERFEGMR